MDWIRENWFWIVVGGLFLWMHTKMHGGHDHAGHGGRDHECQRDKSTPTQNAGRTHAEH